MILGLAFLSVAVGAGAIYLASPNQQATRKHMPRRALTAVGAIAVLGGLLLMRAGPATSVFIAMTLAMGLWTIAPLLIAWWRRPRRTDA